MKSCTVNQPLPFDFNLILLITKNEENMTVVDKYEFTYLGSALSKVVHIEDEVISRPAKACMAFGRLCVNVWGEMKSSP